MAGLGKLLNPVEILYRICYSGGLLVAILFSLIVLITGKGDAMEVRAFGPLSKERRTSTTSCLGGRSTSESPCSGSCWPSMSWSTT